jgi:leader peptidase (prepilin peptidase)/N-methyltransferase
MMASDIPPPFDAAWFRFILGFIIGAALGSFGTMLAYRIPRHISIITPRSHCPTCNATLGARDLVPILSWVTSGGKCRHCHADIGAQYLWIELACSLSGGLMCILLYKLAF